jgi:hypothetical protein
LSTLQSDLYDALNDSVNLLKRFHPKLVSHPGCFSNLRQKLRWMVDGRYQGTVKILETRISTLERSIDRELDLLNL